MKRCGILVKGEDRPSGASSGSWQFPDCEKEIMVGRKEFLAEMKRRLASNGRLVITGPPHIGKTALLQEFARANSASYEHVWFVRGGSKTQRTWDYIAILGLLHLPFPQFYNQGSGLALIRDWLSTHSNWLLVLDDVTSPDELTDFVPPAMAGHLLIASSRPEEWEIDLPLEIGNLSDEDSSVLLRAVGASAQMAENSQVLQHCAGRPGRLLLWAKADKAHAGETVNEDLLCDSTIAPLLADLKTTFPDSWGMLLALSWLSPEDVKRKLLSARFADERLEEIATELASRGFIRLSPEYLCVSRTVQETVRCSCTQEDRENSFRATVKALSEAFPTVVTDYRLWHRCSELMPHVEEIFRHSEHLSCDPSILSRLLNRAGLYAYCRWNFDLAHQLLLRAVKLAIQAFPAPDTRVARIRGNLGLALKGKGLLNEAIRELEEAYRIDDLIYGEDHFAVGIRLSNLGAALRAKGDFERACEISDRAHQSIVRHGGRRHPLYPLRAHNLAQVLWLNGQSQKAIRLAAVAVQAARRIYGEEDPKVAYYSNALAEFLIEIGELLVARRYLNRAREINLAFYLDRNAKMERNFTNLRRLDELEEGISNPAAPVSSCE